MLIRLTYDEKNPDGPRKLLDQRLQVGAWRTLGKPKPRPVGAPDSAPSWWQGDEEASQTFLHAMGIVTTDGSGA